MRIAIIDADIIGKTKHRFPNLACMKLSGYYKSKGYDVGLKLNYEDLESYDKVFISKVFTDTEVPNNVLSLSNVEYGGTGFFYDKAPSLNYDIEHHYPDYELYSDWIELCVLNGANIKEFEYYTDCSIGFTTRGCVRGCKFCVNQNSRSVNIHSPVDEFYNKDRKYIVLLDDNILASPNWNEILKDLKSKNKPFVYRQGMDIRLITEEKAKFLSNCKYKGDYTFSFDNIKDKSVVENKLKLWRKYCKKTTKLFILCGFDENDKYDNDFWLNDIRSIFERLRILMENQCIPYIMRYNKVYESDYKGLYSVIASWCNQPSFFKKMDIKLFSKCRGMSNEGYKKFKSDWQKYLDAGGKKGASWRYVDEFTLENPSIAEQYFSMNYSEINNCK